MKTQPSFYDDIETPAVFVDLDAVERNLERVAQAARERGIKLRPHIKTHKSVYFAHRQLAHGAVGITVAKLSEAEIMVNAGITDVLLAYPPIGPSKLKRLGDLMERADVKVSIDSLEAARGLSELAAERHRTIEVYVDVDTGLRRMGLPPGEPTVDLALQIHRLPGLRVVGVMSHCGHVGGIEPAEEVKRESDADVEALVMTAEMLRSRGVPIREVSPGSTQALPYHLQAEGITELRPGTYIFNDAKVLSRGYVGIEDCAAVVVTTVVSRPAPDRAIVDAGTKTLTSDRHPHREGYGWVKEDPSMIVRRLTEEHGILELPESARSLAVGDRLTIIPNHVCTVMNLSDSVVAVRDGRVVGTIPVSARGCRT